MAKNLNSVNAVSLSFTADTSQARTELNSLKKSLLELSSGAALNTPDFKFTKDLQEASRAAAQLKVQLDSAVNVNTGNLDLTKFSESMKKSGMSLQKYQNQLYQLGPAGEKAFADLTRAITMADVPLKRSSKLLNELWTTMKNTARWQLTSSAMHGFMGAVQSAYGYAQNLNASLNEIRIVTGASVDKMAEFAREANAAAKALSTTTTEYTNASLIFYQQGLSDSAVKERTDITIKMANAAGQSAEIVSDQLTAVWNNFAKVGDNLEYYADVMTALGAATATSTDEIAGGLEKFAAVANTIGLSYEYAASALATITSNTRESEEVVGTALKTIFARIQGLNLGETLDDGVTLNKYSEALQKVGISIFDSTGELKNMDSILSEMGAKWETLNKAQQVALAQTVAGVRQYNQLISLMDNWDSGDSDSMMANLSTAYNAEGTLDQQADIYAESWEAANKRVQASAEAVYSAILNDEFFIDLTNGFAEAIDGVKVFIDSLGGVQGVLLAIGSIITNVFSKQIGQSIENAIHNIKMMTKAGRDSEFALKEQANETLIQGYKDSGTESGGYSAEAYSALAKNQLNYIKNAEMMSEEEQAINQILMDRNRILAEEVIKAGDLVEQTEERIKKERSSLQVAAQRKGQETKSANLGNTMKQLRGLQTEYEKVSKASQTFTNLAEHANLGKGFKAGTKEAQKFSDEVKETVVSMSGIITEGEKMDNTNSAIQKLSKAFSVSREEAGKLWVALQNPDSYDLEHLTTVLNELGISVDKSEATIKSKLITALTQCGYSADEAEAEIKEYVEAIKQFGPTSNQAAEALRKLNNAVDGHNEKMNQVQVKPIAMAEAFSKATSAIMAVGQAWTTLNGIIDVFNNEESTTGDKIMALISGLGMLVPAVMSVVGGLSKVPVASAGANAALVGTGAVATTTGTTISLAMWQVTLIVAAIAAVVGIVAILVTQASKAEKEAARAAKAAEEMKDSAEEAAHALENIKSGFSAYDEAVDKLESCREGTEEWKEALEGVNDTVLQLLQDIPELAANANLFVRDLETGMLKINEAERASVLEAAETQARVTQAMSVVANAMSAKANAGVYAEETSKQIGNYQGVGRAHSDGNGGVWYDDTLEVGKILTENATKLVGLTETEYRQKVAELLRNAANDQAKTYKGFDNQIDALVESAVGYQQNINDLAESTQAAANQMRNAFQLLADQQLGDEFGGAEKTMAGYELEKRTQDLKDTYYKKMTGSGISKASGADNEIYKEIARKLSESGSGLKAATGNTVLGTDSNRRFVFQDANGERVEKSAEWVAQTIAAAEALKELQGSAQNAQNSLETMDEKIAKFGTGNASDDVQGEMLRGFIANQSFENGTVGNIRDFHREVAQYNPEGVGTGAASKTDVAWYVDKMFGDGKDGMISDETAKKYGYETAQQMIDSMYEALSNANQVFESLEIDKLVGFDQLPLDAAVAIDNTFKNMNFGPKGKEAGEQFVSGLNLMVKDLDTEDQQKALAQLANVDWSSWDAMDQAKTIMSEFGVEIDTSDQFWKEFIEDMRKANGAFPDFTSLQKTLQQISGIVGNLNFGDVVDDEDYQALVDYESEWADLFILQADGSRKFIGNSEAMLQATKKNLKEERKELERRKDIYDAINESKLDLDISAMSVDKKYGDGKDGQLSDDTARNHGYENGEDMINNVMASEMQTLINQNEALKALLDTGGYNDQAIKDILQEARDGNRERLEAMIAYANEFMGQDLEVAESELEQMTASMATSLAELQTMLTSGEIGLDAYNRQVEVLKQATIDNAESLAELDAAVIEYGLNSYSEEYTQKLMDIAEGYESCTKELEAYKMALSNFDPDTGAGEVQLKDAEKALRANIKLEEGAKKYGAEVKVLEAQAKRLAKTYDLDAEAAADLAVKNHRMNKGIRDLNDNLNDWKKTLSSADKTTGDYAEAVVDCTEAIANLVGASEDLELPDEFFNTENMALLEQAAAGDVNAINQLGAAVASATVDALEFNGQYADLINQLESWNGEVPDIKLNTEQFDADKQIVLNGINDIKNGLVIAGEAMNGEWVAALNRMALATGMSVEEMNGLLGSMGVQAKVETTYVKQPMTIPTYREQVTELSYRPIQYTKYDEHGEPVGTATKMIPEYTTASVPGAPLETEGYVAVAQISTEDNPLTAQVTSNTVSGGSAPAASYSGNRGSVSPSSTGSGGNTGGGGGGGSRQDKKVDRTKKDEVVERYKELKDKLDDVRDAADKTSASLGRLHGPEKLEAIKKIIAAEQEEMDLLQQQADLAKGHLTEDLAALQTAAGAVGVAFTIDENGNLSNYTDQMNALYERLSAQEAALEQEAADLAAIQSDAAYEAALAEYEVNEQALEQLREQIQELEAAQQQYEETRELLEDIDLQLEEMKGEEALPLVDSDLIDMLQEVDDVLDDIEGSIDRMTQKAERLVGASRIAALKEIAKLERERLATLQRRQQVLDKDIDDKRDAVDTIAARNNVEFEYDENGNIVNYEAQMQKMSQEYRELYEQASADGLITEAEQAGLDALKEDMDELQEYVDAYNEAVEEAESNQEAQLEAYYAWQDANAEALNETLSMKIEIDDRALRRVEYYLNKLDDDFYSSAEAAALLAGQQDIYNSKLGAYEQQLNDLETAYNNGEISLEAYVSGMQECQDGIYENLEALQELDKAMMEYYGETLAKAQDELAKYTDKMNLQMESLSYYQSLLTLMGKQNDYKKMDTILRGQADLLADQVEVAKESAAFFKAEADAKWQLYQNALASGDSAAAELYKKEYEAALEASNQAQSDYIAKSQEYAESLKAVFENTLASINHDFEEALTGGSSFDQLATEMKRAKSLQEEFLTTTNQIYETNKLMHKTQQEIDKSSNSVAKEKLKNFINETQQLQNKTKLSKYELEIQQAKYDLLMAEIALEEAQAAKSTVRLQRDSEGNFGYVYTADSSKVADAEQKLADAQNKLYNVALNGANEYTEKYQQTLSEMYDTLTGLQQQYLNGAFASEEEYNAAVTAAKEYYYAKLEEYSSLHAIALQTDSRVVEEAWSSELSSMVYNTGTWKQNVEQYITDVGIAFNAWHDEMAAILGEAGLASDFSNLGDRVDEVTQDSEELKNEIVNQVLPALQNELQAVSQVTGAWATQRAEMLDTIKQYEDLTTEINTAIDALLELRDLADDPLPNPPEVPEQESSGSDPESAPTPEPAPEQTEQEEDEVESYQTGTLKFEYNAPDRVWTDSASKRYEWGSAESDKMQAAFDKAYTMNGGYTGDYWKGWSGKGGLLDADVLHKKYGLATGGYTGDWEGSYGKLAFLHQKELVLNAGDTENFLASMDLLNKIVSAIDLYSLNSQLSGALYSPTIGSMNNSDTVEQQVHIEASFPNVSSHSEIEEAFNNLVNQASQYANRR